MAEEKRPPDGRLAEPARLREHREAAEEIPEGAAGPFPDEFSVVFMTHRGYTFCSAFAQPFNAPCL